MPALPGVVPALVFAGPRHGPGAGRRYAKARPRATDGPGTDMPPHGRGAGAGTGAPFAALAIGAKATKEAVRASPAPSS